MKSNVLCRFGSPIGKKVLMALSGLGLSLFLVLHLSGNFLLFAGADIFNAYAEKLQSLGPLLWIARLGLLALLITHVAVAINLTLDNKRARPIAYAYEKTVQASLASRTMALTGMFIFAFICFHLAHYTFRITNPEVDQITSKYDMVVTAFKSPLVSGFYIASMVILGMHAWHAVSSLWQTLGINHPFIKKTLRVIGPIYGFLIGGGFAFLPISVLLGILK